MRQFFKIGVLFFLSSIYAQVSDMSSPISFSYELVTTIPLIKTDNLDISKLETDDLIDRNKGLAPRFGYSFLYDINFFDSNGNGIFSLIVLS